MIQPTSDECALMDSTRSCIFGLMEVSTAKPRTAFQGRAIPCVKSRFIDAPVPREHHRTAFAICDNDFSDLRLCYQKARMLHSAFLTFNRSDRRVSHTTTQHTRN